jgi:hypothetical protein
MKKDLYPSMTSALPTKLPDLKPALQFAEKLASKRAAFPSG